MGLRKLNSLMTGHGDMPVSTQSINTEFTANLAYFTAASTAFCIHCVSM